MIHHLHPRLTTGARVGVTLVGCGGNGSQMLTGLARIDSALRALGGPGFHVRAIDPDTVSHANVGRQLFAQGDVGRSKAITLVNRINTFHGLDWDAEPRAFKFTDRRRDLLITCVDTRAARRQIHAALTNAVGVSMVGPPAAYWLDLGNRAADGQVILGEPARNKREAKRSDRLPTVAELLPEITRPGREDNTPSCSLAEALERQELFINLAVVTQALALLWELLRHGQIAWHGVFVNAKTGHARPLPVDPAAWGRMQGTARTGAQR